MKGRHRFTYGANYRHNTLSNNFTENFSREDRLGFYLQEEWNPTGPLTLIAGIRFDLHSEINPTYSPRGALVYKVSRNHTLRGAVSVAYRPPTLFETNITSEARIASTILPSALLVGLIPLPSGCPPIGGGFCALVPFSIPATGSKNLAPEQIISYDLGYQGWFFRHRLRLRADFFFNHVTDLIRFSRRQTTPGDIRTVIFFPVNGGGGDIYGGELGIEFIATPWLTGFANYAHQQNGNTFRNGTKPIVPRSKINAGFRVDFENGLNGEVTGHYVGSYGFSSSGFFNDLGEALSPSTPPTDQFVDSYFLLNLRGAYRFWNEKAEVAVTLFNSLNDRHKEFPRGETIRSRVMGWLTIKL